MSQEKLKDLTATFRKCLESPEPFANEEEKEVCRRMVDDLEDDLVVIAANTSYAYWYLSQNPEACPTEEVKVSMATREARRHYSYMAGDYEKAMKNFVECLEYRRDNNLELLRSCFDQSFPVKPEDADKSKEMAELIRADMHKQYTVMRGQDKKQHTIMIKYPRTKPETTEESYLMSQIYMAERSTAATEFVSLGTQERSMVVFDFYGFDSSNAPPFKMQISVATIVQKLFPERLQVLVMMEPPFWLRGLMNVLTPFLSETIIKRVQMASGVEEKQKVFGALVDPDHATPVLLTEGALINPVSMGHFLEDVPFYCLYDDVKCTRELEEEEKGLHQPPPVPEPSEGGSLTSSLWSSVTGATSSLW